MQNYYSSQGTNQFTILTEILRTKDSYISMPRQSSSETNQKHLVDAHNRYSEVGYPTQHSYTKLEYFKTKLKDNTDIYGQLQMHFMYL